MASKETLFRASLELKDVTGRTLSGIAVPWDRPTLVRDRVGGPFPGRSYTEAFSPRSADVSIKQRGAFPIFVRHDYLNDPLGMVRFSPSPAERALVFDTNPLANTHRADEMLELVNDGSMRSVSVGFWPVNATRSVISGAEVDAYRTEVALRELSLAPTGFGQYEDAGVTAVRADGTDADDDPGALMAAVDAIIDAAVKCLDPTDDDFNPAQAADLLTGAESTVDALLAMFGIPDPDDMEGAARASTHVAELVTRIETARATQPPAPSIARAELIARARGIHLPRIDA